MDNEIREIIINELGSDEAKDVITAIDKVMLEAAPIVPATQERGKTYGDWTFVLPNAIQDKRPDSALNYYIIKQMLRSGAVRFALEMKRSQMFSQFKNKRSIKIHTTDKELEDITEVFLESYFPQMIWELTWHSLAYGSAIAELTFGNYTAYELGISKNKTSKMITMPKVPNFVPHETVGWLKRTNTGEFDGFVQMSETKIALLNKSAEIDIPAKYSLVVPYNGYSRNLWGESFLTPLYPIWYAYEIVLRATVQFAQMMGDPPRLGKAPSRKKVRLGTSTTLVDAIDYLLGLSSALPKTNSVVIPSDVDPDSGKPEWELGYLQIPDRTQPFVTILELFHQMLLRAAMTADHSTTQSSSGSYSIGELHQQATALHNEMVITNWMYYVNKFFIPNISLYNRGPNGPKIWLEISGIDPKERAFFQQVTNIAGNSKSFQEFFYAVDWDTLAELAGLPTLDEQEKEELKKKLHEEALSNQEDQMKMAKEIGEASPPNTPDTTDTTTKPDTMDQVNEKIEQILNSPILSLTYEDLGLVAQPDWDESLIKRDSGGRFAKKAAAAITPPAAQPPVEETKAVTEADLRKQLAEGNYDPETKAFLEGVLKDVDGFIQSIYDEYAELSKEAIKPIEPPDYKSEIGRQLFLEEMQGALAYLDNSNIKSYDTLQDASDDLAALAEKHGVPVPSISGGVYGFKEGYEKGLLSDEDMETLTIAVGGMYDPKTDTFFVGDTISQNILSGDPMKTVILHELLHDNQTRIGPPEMGQTDTDGYNIRNVVGTKQEIELLSGWMEGQNDIMTYSVLTQEYGVPVTLGSMDVACHLINHMKGLTLDLDTYKDNQYNYLLPSGYQEQGAAYAQIAMNRATQDNVPLYDYVKDHHTMSLDSGKWLRELQKYDGPYLEEHNKASRYSRDTYPDEYKDQRHGQQEIGSMNKVKFIYGVYHMSMNMSPIDQRQSELTFMQRLLNERN